MAKEYMWKRRNPPSFSRGGISSRDGNTHWEYAHTESPTEPPDSSPGWQRVFQVGIGSVSGAGSSPARSSSGNA